MATVQVRYIVNDVDAAIAFYCQRLGFHEDMHPAPSFAMLSKGDLRLVLNSPGGPGGGSQTTPDGRKPQPGGWNRSCPKPAWAKRGPLGGQAYALAAWWKGLWPPLSAV